MKNAIFGIRVINWALLMCWLLNALLWAVYPQFTLRTGAFYINMGIIYTLLFVKVKSLSKKEWAGNFTNLKKRLPLLIFMLAMGLLLHRSWKQFTGHRIVKE
ncbi:hypothetical protein [Dyadobacter sp. CY323]|uniref:hypothetical protein n=1 Tax=Dyadobacter sp. CY323 TaxID=2907302 RepID=UPI001F1879B7|nr:hypothetical protein [Dyadobacter sp. CY323]MCE6988869.1 hypothetical protein [Dyadobacter sp. CY323]